MIDGCSIGEILILMLMFRGCSYLALVMANDALSPSWTAVTEDCLTSFPYFLESAEQSRAMR